MRSTREIPSSLLVFSMLLAIGSATFLLVTSLTRCYSSETSKIHVTNNTIHIPALPPEQISKSKDSKLPLEMYSLNGSGYELELVRIRYSNRNYYEYATDDDRTQDNAQAVQNTLKNWMLEHSNHRIISVISTPSATNNFYITHLLITSYKYSEISVKEVNSIKENPHGNSIPAIVS